MKNNILIPVVLLASTPFVVACTKQPTDVPPPPPSVTTETDVVNPVEVMDDVISDDTPVVDEIATISRTETVYYMTPAGSHPVEFSVVVENGVIASVGVTPKADHEISQKLQSAFALGVAEVAVGKKASDLNLDIIAGASLTTGAFNTYVRSF